MRNPRFHLRTGQGPMLPQLNLYDRLVAAAGRAVILHDPANNPVKKEDSANHSGIRGRLREMRRWITTHTIHAAWRWSPMAPPPAIDALQWVLGHAGPITPILARMIKDNMRAAGVYERSAYFDYFRQVARHLANGIRIFQLRDRREAVAVLARQQIEFDESIRIVQHVLAEGQGAVLAPPHCCNFLISLARLRQELPICIYLRWSNNRRKLEMKRQWCQSAGLEVIIEPPSSADPTSRAAACVESLREGKLLVITPDIAQKSVEGLPVQWLGRQIYLPSGPAALAMLAEVPIIPLFAYYRRSRQVLYFEESIRVCSLSRQDGGRKEALRRAMQDWADGFSRFLHRCPQAWFLWGDSRWSRVLRGDSKYTGSAGPFCPPRQQRSLIKELV